MSVPILTVRAASPDDLDTIVSYNRAMALETEEKRLEPATLTKGVLRAMEDPNLCRYFLAEIQGRVVGQTMVTTEWSDWRNGLFWWIQSVYVDPGARRQGVFRALYRHVRDLARAQSDVCGLRLYVYKENERALATYQNLGMTVAPYVLCEEDWSD